MHRTIVRETEIEQIWNKSHLARGKIDVYEGNIEHAISCECCTPIDIYDKNDKDREERQKHSIENKVKRSDENTQYIDSLKVTAC